MGTVEYLEVRCCAGLERPVGGQELQKRVDYVVRAFVLYPTSKKNCFLGNCPKGTGSAMGWAQADRAYTS
jgi:hypothetical protein